MNEKISPHGGNLARAARAYGLTQQEFIDFSASINPLGPSPEVFQALTQSLWRVQHYPDPDWGGLPALLAEHLGVREECLALGNGGAELIFLLPKVLKIKRALIAAPTFSEYATALKAAGCYFEYLVSSKGFYPQVDEIVTRLSDFDTLYLCNPNNPTGHVIEYNELQYILEAARSHGVTVVVDEAFMDFVEGREKHTVMPLAAKSEGLVALYSLTKFFGIPGLRLGAAVAAPKVIQGFRENKDPWSINALALAAGEAALRDSFHMEATLRAVKAERQFLFESLSALGLKVFPGRANFLLVDVSPAGLTSGEVVKALGLMGVLVRDCSNFKGLGSSYIRLAVRKREEAIILLDALKKTLERGK